MIYLSLSLFVFCTILFLCCVLLPVVFADRHLELKYPFQSTVVCDILDDIVDRAAIILNILQYGTIHDNTRSRTQE